MIRAFVPYSPNDVGRAYNECMESLGEDDWGILLDHDAMFGSYDWHDIISKAAKPEYGMLVAMTNRIGCKWQRDPDGWDADSLKYLRDRAAFYSLAYLNQVEDVTKKTIEDDLPGGVCIITSKQTWTTVGGFKSGILGVDNDYFQRVVKHGYKVGLIKGLYVIHWYRGGDRSNKAHLLHRDSR